MHRIALYPGTFDPVTNGHLDVIERAANLFDEVVVLLAVNSKKTPLFTLDERIALVNKSIADVKNVSVEATSSIVVDYAAERGAVALIRGVRAVTDFEYEFQIALMNRNIEPRVDTVFLMPNEKYSYLNSSIIRELGRHKKDVSEFVPSHVAEALEEKFS